MIPFFPETPQDQVTWGKAVSTLLRRAETTKAHQGLFYVHTGSMVFIDGTITVPSIDPVELPIRPRDDGFLIAATGSSLIPVYYSGTVLGVGSLADGTYRVKGAYIAAKEI